MQKPTRWQWKQVRTAANRNIATDKIVCYNTGWLF